MNQNQIFLAVAINILILSSLYFFSQKVDYSPQKSEEKHIKEEFNYIISHYYNSIKQNEKELNYRYEIFKINYQYIQKQNQNKKNLQLKINKFAIYSDQEFNDRFLDQSKFIENSSNIQENQEKQQEKQGLDIGYKSWNWVDKGVVTPARDQGQCQGSYAFSAIGALEGIYSIESGNLEEFSEQQVLDCSQEFGNQGCQGGNVLQAFSYTEKYGIQSEASYPYISKQSGKVGKCKYSEEDVVFQNKKSQQMVQPTADFIYISLCDQPISTMIAAQSKVFRFYSSGVISVDDECGEEADHSVLLTGYKEDGDFWIIKNSWGIEWGNEGFANIQLRVFGKGVCGMQQYMGIPGKPEYNS